MTPDAKLEWLKARGYMRALRCRRGLEDDDESQDADIEAMDAEDIAREWAAWHLGDSYWAEVVIAMTKELR